MLSTPHAGWTNITVFGTTIGSASYLDDVPNMLLDAFIQYFTALRDHNYPGFSITFDAEGYHFGLFLFDEQLYAVDNTNNIPPHLNITEINPENDLDIPSECGPLAILATELIHDIRTDIELWRHWNPYDEDDTKVELIRKTSILKNLLNTGCRNCNRDIENNCFICIHHNTTDKKED